MWQKTNCSNVIQIHLPSLPDSEEQSKKSREGSIIELEDQTMDLSYDVQSISSNESEGLTMIEQRIEPETLSKLTRSREPATLFEADGSGVAAQTETAFVSETLSVVIERSDNSDNSLTTIASGGKAKSAPDDKRPEEARMRASRGASSDKHSGIVLSPLQLGQ